MLTAVHRNAFFHVGVCQEAILMNLCHSLINTPVRIFILDVLRLLF